MFLNIIYLSKTVENENFVRKKFKIHWHFVSCNNILKEYCIYIHIFFLLSIYILSGIYIFFSYKLLVTFFSNFSILQPKLSYYITYTYLILVSLFGVDTNLFQIVYVQIYLYLRYIILWRILYTCFHKHLQSHPNPL